MHASLLILLHADQQASWATFKTNGVLINSATHVSLESIPHEHKNIIVLIPGMDVLVTQANIPSKKRQQKIQAIPYVLEEQLIEDIDKMHFALGDWTSDIINVAVIAHTQMSAYIAHLNTAEITPTVIMPDFLAVPKPPVDTWGILYLNKMVLVRTGEYAGFTIESDCLNTMLTDNPPKHIIVYNNTKAMFDIPVTLTINDHTLFACMVQGIIDNKPLNLLQGVYRTQNKFANFIRPWRLTAVLLFMLAGLYIVKQGIEYQQLSQQRLTLKAQIENVYRTTFPKARKIVNPRVQMEQRLHALRAKQGKMGQNEHFLSLLNKISTPFAQTPGVNIKRIDYRQKRLDIELEIGNLQSLERLKQRLSRTVKVEIQSAISRNQLVESRLRIRNH